MVILYLDTSAAMKLVVNEVESDGLAAMLDGLNAEDKIISSYLLHTELHCGVRRRQESIASARVADVLGGVLLIDLVRADLLKAPVLGAGLRSQDALHLTVALQSGADAIVTYDEEQAAGARAAGLEVLQPQ